MALSLDPRWNPKGKLHKTFPWWKQIRPHAAMDGGVWLRADGAMVLILDSTYRLLRPEDGDPMDGLAAFGAALTDLLELARERCSKDVVRELQRPARASGRRVSAILGSVDRRQHLDDLIKLAALGGGP